MRGDDEMLSKFKINLIFLLCMLSLVSIGFSSWSITLDAINVDANISVDNVVNSEDYIYPLFLYLKQQIPVLLSPLVVSR